MPGIAALENYHKQFGTAFSGFSDMNIHIVQQVADEARVVTRMITRVRHTGAFSGIPATGRTVALASIRIDRIEGGKIAEHWSVGDLAGLMQQWQG
jgi:predicted ester cyclase